MMYIRPITLYLINIFLVGLVRLHKFVIPIYYKLPNTDQRHVIMKNEGFINPIYTTLAKYIQVVYIGNISS